MKVVPINVKASDLSNFVKNNKLCVIKLGHGENENFNSTLSSQLRQSYKLMLKIGFTNSEDLDYNDPFFQSLTSQQMINIGLESSDSVVPGYYLFKESRLVAYHAGTFDISKLDHNSQKDYFRFGLVLSVISGLIQKSWTAGLLTFAATMEAPTGISIFNFFKEILEAKNEVEIRKRQKQVFHDEISKAYAFLKVSKSATDEEVKKAWKNMLKEFHPDKSIDDKEARTKICVSINEAYEIILSNRKAAKGNFSFS